MSTQQLTSGAWTPYAPLTSADQTVFNEALQGFVGVNYKPQSVSTQTVAGTNYRFKCLSALPGSDQGWESIVEIFKPLQGKPHITGIIRI